MVNYSRIIKEKQKKNNEMVIRQYRLKDLDSKPAIREYQERVERSKGNNVLPLTKKEESKNV
jgi:hypothetical protein